MELSKMYKIATKNKKYYNEIMTFLRNNYYYDKDNWLTIQIVSDKLNVKEKQIIEIIEELKTISGALKEDNDKFKITYKGVIHINEIQKSYQNYMISSFALVISYIAIIISLGLELVDALNSGNLIAIISKSIIIIITVCSIIWIMKLLKV